MIAESEMPPLAPHRDPSSRPGPVAGRRAVAVVASATEVLRPRSDLARLLDSFDAVDLLVVADEHEHRGGVVPLPVPGASPPANQDEAAGSWDDESWDDESWDDDDLDPVDDLQRAIAALGLTGVTAHRLGMSAGFGAEAEPDIVAALSELVGFDPEPGVYCLAPAAGADAAGSAVTRAARRIAQVYGLPLLSYRCLELTVVGSDE